MAPISLPEGDGILRLIIFVKYLFIAEKPSLMRSVQSCYQNNKSVVQSRVGDIDFCALSGHVCGLFAPDDYDEWANEKWENISYPIKPKAWGVKAIPQKQGLIDRIQKNIRNYNGVIVGTDSDVEGYGIYWNLERFLHLEGMRALRFIEHSLTEKEILQSLLTMTDYHEDPVHKAAVDAYLVRSRADWLFGMNGTRIMTVKRGTLLRVGRVKAATLGIVYDNSMAIEKFQPEKYYQVEADYGSLKANLTDEKGAVAKFKTSPAVDQYPLEGVVASKKTKRVTEHAPKLFDLTTIQAEAGRKYKYTPAHTLDIIQSLYEKHKVISYPRTQCRFVSTEKSKEFPMMLGHMSAFPDLAQLAARITQADIQRVVSDPMVVNDKEVAKESHDALLPTSNCANPSVMTEEEKNICHMIYGRLLSQFLPIAEDDKTSLVIAHGSGNFTCSGRVVIEQGWRVLFKEAKDVVLPNLNEGDAVQAQSIQPVSKMTTPPKRLTQATLINSMQNIANVIEDENLKKSLAESQGIGTPATRANIIKELIDSKYMEDRKGGLYITQLGKTYIESLDGIDIVSPVFAARLDAQMKKVQHGEETYDEAYAYVCQELDRVCGAMNALTKTSYGGNTIDVNCPFCGSPIRSAKYSWMCSSASCGFKVSKEIAGKQINEKILKTLLTKRVTPQYTFKNKSGKKFKAKLALKPDKTVAFDFSSNA